MATNSKSTRAAKRKPTRAEPAARTFHEVHADMLDQVSALRCVYAAIDTAYGTQESEELSAASATLYNVVTRLNRLHSEFDIWHMHKGREEVRNA
jgi:hypothetical protein